MKWHDTCKCSFCSLFSFFLVSGCIRCWCPKYPSRQRGLSGHPEIEDLEQVQQVSEKV